ncbi:MAG: PSD1 and planctomycete cytochrome C domain-containing protein [Pirellula sp.]
MLRIAVLTYLIATVGFLSTNLLVVHADEPATSANGSIDFVSQVLPLFEKHCWSCHGKEKQESGLRLDQRDKAMLGGDSGKSITPNKSGQSKLIDYVAGTDPEHVMPPEGKRLSAEEIGVLRAWIDGGAVWPDSHAQPADKNNHWSYQPLRVDAPPIVQLKDWPINPIDQFVLAKLEERGLKPSNEANRTTLIRRLSLDLLGLLPSIDEVDAFVSNTRSNAYEELVDRMLDSPHFGERWGRHWLDMARYADSDGYEKDNPRPDAYRWRDWVIDSINEDMPFDQFTIEQLAGDLLPDATDMQRLATAFHRQTLTNTEGGTDQEQFRVEACFDRTETTGAVWLGLTVGCARCHSHKYDAISQREYYQLFAFFNNGDEQTHVVPKSAEDIEAYAVAKVDYDRLVASAMANLKLEQSKLGPNFVAWESDAKELLKQASEHPFQRDLLLDPKVSNDGGVTFTNQKDGSFLASGNSPEQATYTVVGKTSGASFDTLRLDVLADKSLPAKGPGRVKHGNLVLSEIVLEVSETEDFASARKLAFDSAKADHEQADKPWLAKNAVDNDIQTGWAIGPAYGKDHWAEFHLTEPVLDSKPLYVRIRLVQAYGKQHTIGRFKLSLQSGTEPKITLPANVVKSLSVASAERTDSQRQELFEHFSSIAPSTKKLVEKLANLQKKEPPKPELSVRVLAQRVKDPRKTFVLRRGEFLEPLLESEVLPESLGTLPTLQPRRTDGQPDRLDLARWLASTDNPMVPRVTVNHVWRLLFGTGLVKSANDFGVRGEPPTHPELLDWLARHFIALPPSGQAWSRKKLIKQIVMSATYRQSSKVRSDLLDSDPQNQLLARQNRLRVEGEIVRDISLDAAGLLARKIGGPSVFPVLPPGIAELSYAGNFKWKVSEGVDRYRRGMYTFFKRTSPHPNLITFDCPDANLVCVDRNKSNTPLQALVALNNESFSDAARGLANRILGTPVSKGDSDLLAYGFRLCVSRPPSDHELRELADLLSMTKQWYLDHPEDAKKLIGGFKFSRGTESENAAWIATARVLINLDEFITRE